MAEYLSIAEVSRLTGLAPHTIRFYEQQFPTFLAVDRSPGGHRQYRPRHVEALQAIIHLVRQERLSIRDAQLRLGEPMGGTQTRPVPRAPEETSAGGLQQVLALVLEKLDELCRRNAHLDSLLGSLLQKGNGQDREDLLRQIARYREEHRQALSVYQELLQRGRGTDRPGQPAETPTSGLPPGGNEPVMA